MSSFSVDSTESSLSRSPPLNHVTPSFSWHGTCVHNFDTPRWVQKQRKLDPDEPLHERDRRLYVEPRTAVVVAVNGKFSLLAIGMLG